MTRLQLAAICATVLVVWTGVNSLMRPPPRPERPFKKPTPTRSAERCTIKRAVFGGSGATLIDFAVQEPLEQLRAALAKVYADKPIALSVAVAPGTAYPIDAGDFLELAGNLMDNACKYCRGAVAVRATPWTAAAWRRPGLVLEIEDDGSGIPPAERARVLEDVEPGA